MIKKTVLIVIIVLGFTCLNAQTITVKDILTLESIPFATVLSTSTDEYVVSGTNGQVDISEFKEDDRIEISMLGYYNLYMSYQQIIDNNFTVHLTQSSITLNQVIISATKWKQDKRDVPVRVIKISAKDISINNPQTSADLLSRSGDVFVQKSQQGGGSPMIRGFATNRLLISVDGVRMNNAIFRSGNIQNVIAIDPYSIEQAEVLFGPGSVIYGSDAIGGVMSFKTFEAQLGDSTNQNINGAIDFRMSSANKELSGHYHVNVGWEKFASLTSMSYNSFSDLKMGSFGPEEYLQNFYVKRADVTDFVFINSDQRYQNPTAYKQFNILQKIRFKPSDKWDFNYSLNYSESSNNPRYDRLIQMNDSLPKYAEWYYGPQVWMLNNFSIEHHDTTALYDEMVIRIAHQHFEESRHSRKFNSNDLISRFEEVEAFSANIDFSKKISKAQSVFYGVEGIYDIVKSMAISEDIFYNNIVSAQSRYPQSNWSSYAAYATHKFDISEKLEMLSGLRYNQYLINSTFDTTFMPLPFTEAKINNGGLTGSVGLVYNPQEKWTTSVNFSTGYRAPNVDDIGKVFDSEPGAVVVPNSDLKAEYAYNSEINVAKVFGDFMKLDLSGYYTYLNNALVRRDYTLNGADSIFYDGELSRVQAIQNASHAMVYGVQSGIEIKLPAGIGFSSQFSWQKGIEELDDGTTSPLRHAAPWFGKTELYYEKRDFRISVTSSYCGEISFENLADEERYKTYIYAIDENGNPYSPSWLTFDVRAIYKIKNGISFNIGLENITDQRYRTYSSGMVAPGRNLVFGVRGEF